MLKHGFMAAWFRYSSSEKYTLPMLAVDSPSPPLIETASGAAAPIISSVAAALPFSPAMGSSCRGVTARSTHSSSAP